MDYSYLIVDCYLMQLKGIIQKVGNSRTKLLLSTYLTMFL